jgi:hypothetical protein
MSEPEPTALRAAIVTLFHDALSRFPPPHAPGAEPAGPPPYRLGDYLVYQGYLLPRQLQAALAEAEGQAGAAPIPLGAALVSRHGVPAAVLAATLLLQALDRIEQSPDVQPAFLGEQLLREAYIDPAQLAAVLQEQVSDYEQGHWSRIGDLIARHGWLDAAALEQIARELRAGPPPAD